MDNNPDGEYLITSRDMVDVHRRLDLNLRRLEASIKPLKGAADECDINALLTHFTEAQEAEGGTEDLVLTFPKDKYIVDTWHLTGNLMKEVNNLLDNFEENCVCRVRTGEEKTRECVLRGIREGKAEFIIARDCEVPEKVVREVKKYRDTHNNHSHMHPATGHTLLFGHTVPRQGFSD
ncbi:unnamed protein product [marine sediment metagenome]|uniref:Uncharacterized protein n=2 Tax=marine sediment metagenome TaxID=412755 RepID=X1ED17_9ZZZZ